MFRPILIDLSEFLLNFISTRAIGRVEEMNPQGQGRMKRRTVEPLYYEL